jgi:hypothetical protein
LLAPGFIQSACVHGIKADVVDQFHNYFFGLSVVT